MKKAITQLILLIFLLTTEKADAQNVGIGVNNPQQKLEVNGAVKIGSNDATAPAPGTMRWNAAKKDFEGYTGTAWVSLTAGKANWGSTINYAYPNAGSDRVLYHNGKDLGTCMSAWDNVVVAGAPGDEIVNASFANVGSVRGFSFTNERVTPASISQVSRPAGSRQGTSVAINQTYIISGAQGDYDGKGAVYVFNRSTGTNVAIVPTDAAENDNFGTDVSLDGSFLAVGSPNFKINGISRGKVYLYSNLGNNWF